MTTREERIEALKDKPSTRVLVAIGAERMAQDEKWGEQNHLDGTGPRVRVMRAIGDRTIGRNMQLIQAGILADAARDACDHMHREGLGTWADILLEEVFEALSEDDEIALREELIQVAAVAAAWAEAIDRRNA